MNVLYEFLTTPEKNYLWKVQPVTENVWFLTTSINDLCIVRQRPRQHTLYFFVKKKLIIQPRTILVYLQ